MSFVVFTLTASGLCLYFAFAAGIKGYAAMYLAALAAVLLGSAACACGCGAARRDPRLRFLFAPLPLLALLLIHGWVQALILAPAVAYSEAILFSGRFKVSWLSFRNHIIWSGFAFLGFLLIQILVDGNVIPATLCGTVSLVLGVFSLRQLRFGVKTGPKQRALELLSVSAVPTVLGLFLLLARYVGEILNWLGVRVFYPLGQMVMGTVELVRFLFPPPEGYEAETETATEAVASTAGATEATMSPAKPVPPGGENVDKIVVAILLLAFTAVMICLIIWIIRRLRETRTEEEPEAWKQPETGDDGNNVRAREKTERFSNRRRVRRSYEQYLELLRKRRFNRRPQDNSEDILEKTRALASEEPAEALRTLYIRARYDPESELTGAEVREARRLLKELREKDP